MDVVVLAVPPAAGADGAGVGRALVQLACAVAHRVAAISDEVSLPCVLGGDGTITGLTADHADPGRA